MNSKEISQLAVETLEAHKAVNIVNLDVRELTDIMDTMIVCSSTSRRHGSAMANRLVRAMRDAGIRPYGIEGETVGEWILIDLTDIVVHIMLPEIREFYNLEKLWSATQAKREQRTVEE